MKKVAVLTTFDNIQEAYSLNIVVQTQLKMLLQHGYKPILIATQGFDKSIEAANKRKELGFSHVIYNDVEIRMYKPVAKANSVGDYKDKPKFDADVNSLYEDFTRILQDIDVVITHDLVYQPDALKHQLATRMIAEKNDKIKWLHWIHSATTPQTLSKELKVSDDTYIKLTQKSFPNSTIVYPNEYNLPLVARLFNVDIHKVKCVNHAIDITQNFDPLLESVLLKHYVLQADAIAVYPLRLDRGKQAEIMIKIMASLKNARKLDVRIIFADFHSTMGDKVKYRNFLKELAEELGVQNDTIFLSEYSKSWAVEMPHKVITDLMSISNVFILPSKSETYSLVAQEAALAGNVLMLNQDFPPLRSVYKEFPIYKKFSSGVNIFEDVEKSEGDTQTTYNPSEWTYWDDCAIYLHSRLQNDLIARQRTYFRKTKNLSTIFIEQLEPLINA
jgi:glycosyltransferase involved in cell wall biosynthesis